jgi:hypothetical protein
MIYLTPENCIFDPLVTLTFDLWPFRCPQVTSRVSVYVCAKIGGDRSIKSRETLFYARKLYFWPLVTLTFDLWPFWCHHVTSQGSFYVGAKFGGDLSVISRELIYFMPNNSISDPSWPWPLTFWIFDAPMLLPAFHSMPVPSVEFQSMPVQRLEEVCPWKAEKYSILCPKTVFLTPRDLDLWPLTFSMPPMLLPEFQSMPVQRLEEICPWKAEKYSILCPKTVFLTPRDLDLWPLCAYFPKYIKNILMCWFNTIWENLNWKSLNNQSFLQLFKVWKSKVTLNFDLWPVEVSYIMLTHNDLSGIIRSKPI